MSRIDKNNAEMVGRKTYFLVIIGWSQRDFCFTCGGRYTTIVMTRLT